MSMDYNIRQSIMLGLYNHEGVCVCVCVLGRFEILKKRKEMFKVGKTKFQMFVFSYLTHTGHPLQTGKFF